MRSSLDMSYPSPSQNNRNASQHHGLWTISLSAGKYNVVTQGATEPFQPVLLGPSQQLMWNTECTMYLLFVSVSKRKYLHNILLHVGFQSAATAIGIQCLAWFQSGSVIHNAWLSPQQCLLSSNSPSFLPEVFEVCQRLYIAI